MHVVPDLGRLRDAPWAFTSTPVKRGSPLGARTKTRHGTHTMGKNAEESVLYSHTTFLVARLQSPRSCFVSSVLTGGAFLFPCWLISRSKDPQEKKQTKNAAKPCVEAGRQILKGGNC